MIFFLHFDFSEGKVSDFEGLGDMGSQHLFIFNSSESNSPFTALKISL